MLDKTIYTNDEYLKLKMIEADANGYFYNAVYHMGKLVCYKLTKKEDKKPCNCSGRT